MNDVPPDYPVKNVSLKIDRYNLLEIGGKGGRKGRKKRKRRREKRRKGKRKRREGNLKCKSIGVCVIRHVTGVSNLHYD